MALVTDLISLKKDYRLLIDNTGDNSSSNNFVYINKGTAELRFDKDTPSKYDFGMRWSAGAHVLYVPEGSKLYGRLSMLTTVCDAMVNIES